MTLSLDKSNWKNVAFGDVIDSITNRVDDPSTAEVDRYVGLEHLDPGVMTVQRWGTPDDVSAQKLLFAPGDVIFGRRRAYQKKVARADFRGICSAHALVLRARPDFIEPDFLPVFLSSDYFLDRAISISVGSLSPTVNWRDLKSQEFFLPPLGEQKRLAALLWAIERHKQCIAADALERIENLYLAGLLTESAGQLKPISAMGSVLMGRQRSPIHATGDHMVSYLRVANVGDNILRLEDVKQMNFTPEEQKRYEVRSGDILISEGQSRELVGQSVLISDLPERMCFQNTLIRFRADHSIVRPEYAQALFRACLHAGVFASIAAQTTSIAHLGAQRFAQLQVRVPSLHEQDRVMEELAHIQAARESIQAELSALLMLSSQISRQIFGAAE